jgi:methyl-accepting chemotaxis protein
MWNSVAFRLAAAASLAIATILGATGWFMTDRTEKAVVALGKTNLEQLVETSAKAVEAYNRELESEAANLSAVFGYLFPGEFTLDPARQVDVLSERVPAILSGGQDIAGDYSQVDEFAQATGGNATIFVRRGNDFVRVVTSVQKENGDRAVGTLLSRDSPAYERNIKGEPFNGKVTLFGRKFVTNYTPIKNSGGRVIGIRYIGKEFSESLSALREGLGEQKVGESGYVFIMDASNSDQHGELVLHPTFEGRQMNELSQSTAGFVDTASNEQFGQRQLLWSDQGQAEPWEVYFRNIPKLDWVVAAAAPASELTGASDVLSRTLLFVTLATIALVAIILGFTSRALVSRPLTEAVEALTAIADGDYTREVKVSRKDETGQLQQALKTMQTNVRRAMGEISGAAQELAGASQQLAVSSDQVARGSREQSQSATSMASTIEELTTNIEHLAANASEANEISQASSEKSERGASVIKRADSEMQRIAQTVRDASGSMEELDELSQQITSIIEVIGQIAEQTNLLALNAAIEAARAGEQGRGFAVVADEVRNLAGRTTASAHEITGMIERLREGTHKAVTTMNNNVKDVEGVAELANEAGTSIRDIQEGANRVVSVFSEISERLSEQSKASNEVAQSVEQIATMTGTNDSAIQESARATSELDQMAKRLQAIVGRFRV